MTAPIYFSASRRAAFRKRYVLLTNWLLFFFVAVFSCALFLYVPGYLGARGVGFSGRMSVVAAPVVSIVLFCLIGIDALEGGDRVHRVGRCFCVVPFVAAPFAVPVVMERRPVSDLFGACGWDETCSRGASLAALYIAVSLVAAVFLRSAPRRPRLLHADSMTTCITRSCAELLARRAIGRRSIPPCIFRLRPKHRSLLRRRRLLSVRMAYRRGDGGRYLRRLGSLHLQNAINPAFAVFVYPIGMLALMSRIFGLDSKALWFGAVCTPAFSAFPWVLLLQWPLSISSRCRFSGPRRCCSLKTTTRAARVSSAYVVAGASVTIVAFYFRRSRTRRFRFDRADSVLRMALCRYRRYRAGAFRSTPSCASPVRRRFSSSRRLFVVAVLCRRPRFFRASSISSGTLSARCPMPSRPR